MSNAMSIQWWSESPKTIKSARVGVKEFVCYLAPHTIGALVFPELIPSTVCAGASIDCMRTCLAWHSGQAGMVPMGASDLYLNECRAARLRRLAVLYSARDEALDAMAAQAVKLASKAREAGMLPAFRPNGGSDLFWLGNGLAKRLNGIAQVFDYTKLMPSAMRDSNYHLTYSYNGENMASAMRALEIGINVAIVFAVPKKRALPMTWRTPFGEYPVIDGDEHDASHAEP